jgi:hypothetical protein
MIIKREGYPDVTDSDMKPFFDIKPLEPIIDIPIRTRIGEGIINPRGISGNRHLTTIIGEDKNS